MIISTVSLKGGAGKSTIAVNLAVELAHRNYKISLIDADPNNQSVIKWSGFRPENLPTITIDEPMMAIIFFLVVMVVALKVLVMESKDE